jgi:hypothetical protein
VKARDEKFVKFFLIDWTEGLDKHRSDLHIAALCNQIELVNVNAMNIVLRELFELYLLAIHWILTIDTVSLTRWPVMRGRILTV